MPAMRGRTLSDDPFDRAALPCALADPDPLRHRGAASPDGVSGSRTYFASDVTVNIKTMPRRLAAVVRSRGSSA